MGSIGSDMPLITENLETFADRFSKSFWKAINKQYFDELEPETTQLVIEGVHSALVGGTYSPSKPKYYIDKDKGSGVLRRIPVLEPKDYAVYFYCISMLEEKIASNRVPNTYGGWSLRGLLRNSEDKQIQPLTGELVIVESDEVSIPTFSYNEYAWANYYGDYQKKLYATLKDCIKKPEHMKYIAVQFDIANFYDNIKINLLEKNLRSMCTTNEAPVVDLLCHFLKYWNRDVHGYEAQQNGIPQDAFADCSRIMANYYLQSYDDAISKYSSTKEATYFRYADDQIVIARNLTDARDILHMASIELSKLGLNINKAKVKYHSINGLIEHFSFTEFRKLHENGKNPEVLDSVVKKYLRSTTLEKRHSLLSKILGQDINLLRQDMRTRVLADAYSETFITGTCKAWTLERIYKRLTKDERVHFLDYLDVLTSENEFTSFHFEVLAFYRKIKKDVDVLVRRIRFLQAKWS